MKLKPWSKFLYDLDGYLYEHGWYVQGNRIKDRNYPEGSYESIVQYLTDHCYEEDEAEIIVYNLKYET